MGRECIFEPRSELPTQLPERTRSERASEAGGGGGASGNIDLNTKLPGFGYGFIRFFKNQDPDMVGTLQVQII
jgi:hypothetical protein